MIRIRLDLAYDGTGFSGWAVQPGLRTVQGTVQEALTQVLRTDQPVRVTVAGRTDAGVHARAQVVHFDVPEPDWNRLPGRSPRTSADALVARLTGVLPDDVFPLSAQPAPEGFDARFSALSRRYSYRIADAASPRDPLVRRQVLRIRSELDVHAMDRAGRALVGLRDFAAFCKPRPGASTIRELQEFSWSRTGDGYVEARIRSDAFCHNMVRALVGAVLLVGEGTRPHEWPMELLRSRERSPHVKVLAPVGLVLEEVAYPDPAELASRAEAIRARRSEEELQL